MKLFYLLPGLILLASTSALSQSHIYGKITDEGSGKELPYANIVFTKNGVFHTEGTTDVKGNYLVVIDSGTYEAKVSYTGLSDRVITGVIVNFNTDVKLDMMMRDECFEIAIITTYKVPLIQESQTFNPETFTSKHFRNQPQKTINQLLINTPGVSLTNF